MIIKLRSRTLVEWGIFFILVLSLTTGFFKIFTNYASILSNLIDLILLVLFILSFKKYTVREIVKNKKIYIWIFIFFSYSVITSLWQINSGTLFLLGLKNNFCYFLFFILCLNFVKDYNLEFIDKIYWINFILSLIQYFIFDIKQDWLGGIFGVNGGEVNAPLNTLLLIALIKNLVYFVNKKNNLTYTILIALTSLFVASLAELKFFYFEFVMVSLLIILLTSFSLRKVIVLFCGASGFLLGSNLLFLIFPGLDDRLFTFDFLMKYVSSTRGYTGAGDLNRLSFISQLSSILSDWKEQLFGIGLGNGEVLRYFGLYSDFYLNFSYLHYTWLSSSFIYVELGLIGMIIYFLFFILLFIEMKSREKYAKHKEIYQMSSILSLMVIPILIYNASMRSDIAYLVYYLLALPFVQDKIEGS